MNRSKSGHHFLTFGQALGRPTKPRFSPPGKVAVAYAVIEDPKLELSAGGEEALSGLHASFVAALQQSPNASNRTIEQSMHC